MSADTHVTVIVLVEIDQPGLPIARDYDEVARIAPADDELAIGEEEDGLGVRRKGMRPLELVALAVVYANRLVVAQGRQVAPVRAVCKPDGILGMVFGREEGLASMQVDHEKVPGHGSQRHTRPRRIKGDVKKRSVTRLEELDDLVIGNARELYYVGRAFKADPGPHTLTVLSVAVVTKQGTLSST
jgi:hypothetical protein